MQVFNCELAIYTGYHNGAMNRGDSSINYEQVARVNACLNHAIATSSNVESRRRMLNTDLVEVDSLFNVVLCRARKATNGWGQKQRKLKRFGLWSRGRKHGCTPITVFIHSMA